MRRTSSSISRHLQVIERIDGGAAGQVYRAHDPKLQIDVALKLVRQDRVGNEAAAESFLREARRLAHVRHANVLTVHGADEHDGRVGLWSDLIEGQTLETCVSDQGTYGAHEAVAIGLELCQALAAVHAAGLIHQDVKTSNIMREKGGRIVLLDFSSARGRREEQRLSGTPLYMAPEVIAGGDPDPRSDIYSAGVVLFRLVSGRYPVEAGSLSELRDKHRRGEVQRLRDLRPDLPAAFVRVVEKATAAQPAERYATAGQMESALAGTLAWHRRWLGRPWQRVAAVAAAVLLVVVAAWLIPPTPAFDVDARLFRSNGGREERLLPGAGIRPGDDLFLQIKANRAMHVYVINEDEEGQKFVLFPLPSLDLHNPLPGGTTHRLPGTVGGIARYWDVTSPGTREIILVVASRHPLEEVESLLDGIPRAGSGEAVRLENEELLPRLRGIGGLQAVPGEQPHPARDITDQLSMSARRSEDTWVWEINLTNPQRSDPPAPADPSP